MDVNKVKGFFLKKNLGKGWADNPQPSEANWISKSLPYNWHLSVSFNIEEGKPHYWVCLFDGGLEQAEVECSELNQVKAEVRRLEMFVYKKLATEDTECFTDSDVTELVADLYRRLHDVDALI